MLPTLLNNNFAYTNKSSLNICIDGKYYLYTYNNGIFKSSEDMQTTDTPSHSIQIVENDGIYTIPNTNGKCQFILTVTGSIDVKNNNKAIYFVNGVRVINISTVSDCQLIVITNENIEYTGSATVSGKYILFQ